MSTNPDTSSTTSSVTPAILVSTPAEFKAPGCTPARIRSQGVDARLRPAPASEPRFAVDHGRAGLREWLPGDERYGDPLSTGGGRPSEVAGRQLSELTAESPGVVRELGLGAVQVWQALSEAQGRGRGDEELAIVFTDLSGFSSWALDQGDTVAVSFLRDVGDALEPPITHRGGTIVKRLGDGLMAVFADPQAAVDAVLDACERWAVSIAMATARTSARASTWEARDGWARTTSGST